MCPKTGHTSRINQGRSSGFPLNQLTPGSMPIGAGQAQAGGSWGRSLGQRGGWGFGVRMSATFN